MPIQINCFRPIQVKIINYHSNCKWIMSNFVVNTFHDGGWAPLGAMSSKKYKYSFGYLRHRHWKYSFRTIVVICIFLCCSLLLFLWYFSCLVLFLCLMLSSCSCFRCWILLHICTKIVLQTVMKWWISMFTIANYTSSFHDYVMQCKPFPHYFPLWVEPFVIVGLRSSELLYLILFHVCLSKLVNTPYIFLGTHARPHKDLQPYVSDVYSFIRIMQSYHFIILILMFVI